MLTRILTAGTLAGSTLLSPLASPAGAAPSPEPQPDRGDHCLLPPGESIDDRSAQCFPTLAEATRAAQSRASVIVASHYTGAGGNGQIYYRSAPSCSNTWIPSETWSGTLSSTAVSSACTGAKHYTNSDCSGSFQIVTLTSPTSLQNPLNDNVGCVKYS